jgi:hypothetical protein
VKLRVHTIVQGGRYFKAGEDVPDELVSPALAKYAVREEGDRDAPTDQRSAKTKRRLGRHVRLVRDSDQLRASASRNRFEESKAQK